MTSESQMLKSENPFERIALMLSGGGYRSAMYQLGTMTYLQHIGLLDKVKIISTVSGGTFPGMIYSLAQKQGQGFDVFFKAMYRAVEVNMLEEALKLLGKNQLKDTNKRVNLINAFAQIYQDQMIEGDYHFDVLLDSKKNSGLEDMIFNATWMNTGNPFRFQAALSEDAFIGNRRNRISRHEARVLRLGDIIAASSAFPILFEPIDFPGDFMSKTQASAIIKNGNSSPMMDGGTIDNQGIHSALHALARRCTNSSLHKESEQIENVQATAPWLFIVSDVDTESGAVYEFPESSSGSSMSVNMIYYIGIVLMLIIMVFVADSIVEFKHFSRAHQILCGLMLLISAGLIGILFAIKSFVKSTLLGHIPRVNMEKVWKHIKNMKMEVFLNLIGQRLNLLWPTVYNLLKGSRALNYDSIYSLTPFERYRIANIIDDLGKEKVTSRQNNLSRYNPQLQTHYAGISDPIQQYANQSKDFSTTLWFDDLDANNHSPIRDVLISAGASTMCFNLIEYIYRNFDVNYLHEEVQSILDQSIEDWQKFNTTPDWLVAQMKTQAEIQH